VNKELFEFLNTDLQFIKGVGPVLAARLDDLLGGRRILDFLLHKPSYVKPRGMIDSVMNAQAGDVITIQIKIESHKAGIKLKNGRRTPTQVLARDNMNAPVSINFYGASFLDYWLEKLPIGEVRIVSGKLEFNNKGGASITHPDFIEKVETADKIPENQAIYPISAGLTQKIMANVREQVFAKLATSNEQPAIKDFFDAIKQVHFAESNDDFLPTNESVQKLAYSELFAHQVAIALSRAKRKRGIVGRMVSGDGQLREKLYASLPFKLTDAQNKAITEIENDMARTEPMLRLVQGDVGSGKTIVALAAALNAAECKIQTALMAPTDTLAQQHYAKIKPICDSLGVHVDILTGRDKGKSRTEKLISLKSGRTRIVIGTHALFSDDVVYKDLGLVIIDEQHRFGVAQRAALCGKGNNPDFLALSATPIPRTLSMTIYGDMDISIINEKPVGRLPIKTTKLGTSKLAALAERARVQINSGAKVFWVCPLVVDNPDMDFMAAETRYNYLRERMPDDAVGLVHGQMDKKERDKVMEQFADPNGRIKLLVATSVIEVGIDVPHATIMIIENAEKFGLSALHQLRGRVGRSDIQSFCVLLHGERLTENGEQRLDVLVNTDDGFIIAEQDLIMRGAGEMIGTRQHGWVPYYFVDYREHRDLFKLAAARALELANNDPTLSGADGHAARDMIYIFGRIAKIDG